MARPTRDSYPAGAEEKIDNAFGTGMESGTTENEQNGNGASSALEALEEAARQANEAAIKNSESQKEFAENITKHNTEKKESAKLTETSKRILGQIDVKLNALANKTKQATNRTSIINENSRSARILGYIVKTDERTDFVKRTHKMENNDVTYGFGIKNYGPSPVVGVIIGAKTDILNQLGKSSEDIFQLTASDVDAAKNSSAYTISIISKAQNELWDWIVKNTAGYINESQDLFVPYKKYTKNMKDGTVKPTNVDAWDASDSVDPTALKKRYLKTDGKAGISAELKQRGKSGSKTSDNLITYNSTQDVVLQPYLVNTARPKLGLAPGNYIATSKFETIAVKDLNIADESTAQDYTSRYFDRWLHAKKNPVSPASITKDRDKTTVNLITTGTSTAIADCFAPSTYADFWNTVSVDHWYDVDDAVKGPKEIKDIHLVNRVSVTVTGTDNTTKQVVRVAKLAIDTDKYPFIIPDRISSAINSVQPSYLGENLDEFKSAVNRISTVKTTTGKATSGTKTRKILGFSFAEILKRTDCSSK